MFNFLLPLFGVTPEEPLLHDLNMYAYDHMYSTDYKTCSLMAKTKFYNQPFRCIDENFVIYTLERVGFSQSGYQKFSKDSSKITYSKDGVDVELNRSEVNGFVSMVVKLPLYKSNIKEHKEIMDILDSQHGMITGSGIDGWITSDDIDIHVDLGPKYAQYSFVKRYINE